MMILENQKQIQRIKMKNNKILKWLLSGLFLLSFSSQIFAENGSDSGSLESVIKIMIALTAFLIAFVLWLVLVYAEKNDTKGSGFLEPVKHFIHMLTKSTPITEESKILIDHEYDGIRELDNKLPPWFIALFYGTIIFAVIYMVNYHIIGDGKVMEDEYAAEVKQAKIEQQLLSKSGAMIDEETVTQLKDATSLANGKAIFVKDCVACHGQNAEGIVGPNLTDDYWIHGGGIKNVFHTIKYGVPAKGMISWEAQLSPTKMQEVGSYILSLRGTKPANPKAVEGTLWKPDEASQQNSNSK